MLNYYCPTCQKWLDRSGFTEVFATDYQEQLCRTCNEEVWYEGDRLIEKLTPKFYEVSDDVTQLRQRCDRVRQVPRQLNLFDLEQS